MGMAVAIVPGLFVAVVAAGRDELIQQGGKVLDQAGFVFNGPKCGGAADVEYVGRPGMHARVVDDLRDFIGEIVHLAMFAGIELYLFLINHDHFLAGMLVEGKTLEGVETG